MVAREYGGVSGSIDGKRGFLVFPDRCQAAIGCNKMIQFSLYIIRNCIRFLFRLL